MPSIVISGISPGFPELSQCWGQVAHVLLPRSPLGHSPEGKASLDLHVLSTPPAFVLSQDQTLRECLYDYPGKPGVSTWKVPSADSSRFGMIAGPYELTYLFCSM